MVSKCTTLYDVDALNAHSLGEVLDASLETCCKACDQWTGAAPCVGYEYNPATSICSLKWKLGTLTLNQSSSVIIGYPGKQNFKQILKNWYPSPWDYVGDVQHNILRGPKECAFYCLNNPKCRSFVITSNSPQICAFTDYTTRDLPNLKILEFSANIDYYEIQYNRNRNDTLDLSTITIGIEIMGKIYNGANETASMGNFFSDIQPKTKEACALLCAQTLGCLSVSFEAASACNLYKVSIATSPQWFTDHPTAIYLANIR